MGTSDCYQPAAVATSLSFSTVLTYTELRLSGAPPWGTGESPWRTLTAGTCGSFRTTGLESSSYSSACPTSKRSRTGCTSTSACATWTRRPTGGGTRLRSSLGYQSPADYENDHPKTSGK